MDIISGLVVVASVFMLAMALTSLVVGRPAREADAEAADRALGVTRVVLTTLLVVYFVATTQLLLIAQQLSLALGNFVIALLVLVILYGESFHFGGRPRGGGDWRR